MYIYIHMYIYKYIYIYTYVYTYILAVCSACVFGSIACRLRVGGAHWACDTKGGCGVGCLFVCLCVSRFS